MKIAVASDSGTDGEISAHFGRCGGFAIFSIEKNRIAGKTLVKNPFCGNHIRGAVPRFLISRGVDVVITGGAGPAAVDMLDEAGIQVVFCSGRIRDAVERYLDGKIGKADNTCRH